MKKTWARKSRVRLPLIRGIPNSQDSRLNGDNSLTFLAVYVISLVRTNRFSPTCLGGTPLICLLSFRLSFCLFSVCPFVFTFAVILSAFRLFFRLSYGLSSCLSLLIFQWYIYVCPFFLYFCLSFVFSIIHSSHCLHDTLIKKKIKLSSYIGKFRVEQLQSHIWGRAS
jgi:hypothetical protein